MVIFFWVIGEGRLIGLICLGFKTGVFDWFILSGRVRRECLISLICLGDKTRVFDWFNLSGVKDGSV